MHCFKLFVLILCVSVPVSSQTVTFQNKSLPVGITVSSVDSMTMDGSLTVMAEGQEQSFPMKMKQRKRAVRTILAYDGDELSRYRIRYEDAYEEERQPMRKPKISTPPVTDIIYVYERLGDEAAAQPSPEDLDAATVVVHSGWSIRREDGKPLSKEESEYLTDKVKEKEMDASIRQVLDGRTVTVGEDIVIDNRMLEEIGEGFAQGKLTPTEVTLRLRDVKSQDGTQLADFDFSLTMKADADPFEMEAVLKGSVTMGVENLWMHSLELGGPLTGAGMHQGATVGIDGEMQRAGSAEYNMEE
ncbi:MAG: hypothetical protein JXA28_06590 [Bacteroidetes bacterium]|nr:hypothetical protein [Bacteroidota bacterium]